MEGLADLEMRQEWNGSLDYFRQFFQAIDLVDHVLDFDLELHELCHELFDL